MAVSLLLAEKPLFLAIEICSVMQILNAIAAELHSGGLTDVKVDDLRLFKVILFFSLENSN